MGVDTFSENTVNKPYGMYASEYDWPTRLMHLAGGSVCTICLDTGLVKESIGANHYRARLCTCEFGIVHVRAIKE